MNTCCVNFLQNFLELTLLLHDDDDDDDDDDDEHHHYHPGLADLNRGDLNH